MKVILNLSWPPSVNHYWGQHGKRRFVSQFGKAYRQEVWAELKNRLHVKIIASPPDNRKRDLDNILKSLLDAMTHAGVYEDDEQIDALELYRMNERDGSIQVAVIPL
jgi:crossover junction endodeoxyribonuclease RusA